MELVHEVLAAARFAAEKHAQQRRKGTGAEPYVNHVIEVAQLVSMAVAEADVGLVQAALLHDTLEDTRTTAEELIEQFGQDVAALVMEMTDDKRLPKAERKRLQIEHAPTITTRAQTIKLADKISNLRSLLTSPPVDWDYERKRQYFEWARQVVDALSAPNRVLLDEFERVYERVGELNSP
ncbi:MAG TPA: HD domain-containing protein [Bryobacteraceae bacterium]